MNLLHSVDLAPRKIASAETVTATIRYDAEEEPGSISVLPTEGFTVEPDTLPVRVGDDIEDEFVLTVTRTTATSVECVLLFDLDGSKRNGSLEVT